MKKRGTMPDAYLQTIAGTIVDKTQGANALVDATQRAEAVEKEYEQLQNAVPKAKSEWGNSKASKGVFCYPCISKFDEFVDEKKVSNIRFSDTIALHNKVVEDKGSCENVVYMAYQKTNLAPTINLNDILVVKTTNNIEGEGYYVYKLEHDVKVDTLEACTREHNDNVFSKVTVNDIIGKVIGIYREM